jgi:hypothetical protein
MTDRTPNDHHCATCRTPGTSVSVPPHDIGGCIVAYERPACGEHLGSLDPTRTTTGTKERS